MDSHKSKLLKQSMYHRNNNNARRIINNDNSRDSNDKQDGLKILQSSSSTDAENLRVPVFLNRNRRKMKELRKHLWQKPGVGAQADGELKVENGLVLRQVPNIKKLMYDAQSTDFMVYKRRRISVDKEQIEQ